MSQFDFNPNVTAGNTPQISEEVGEAQATGAPAKTAPKLDIDAGITETSEIGKKIIFDSKEDGKPILVKPQIALDAASEFEMTLSENLASLLGKQNATYKDLVNFFKEFLSKEQVCVGNKQKIDDSEEDKNGSVDTGKAADVDIDLSKLDGDSLAFLCVMLCQKSKSEMVQTLKNVLSAKIKDKEATNAAYLDKLNETAQKNLDAIEAQKAAKKRSLFKAIFSLFATIVTTIVGVALTVSTFGAAAPALCVAAATLTVVGGLASATSDVLTIAMVCEKDPEKQQKLNTACMALGICGAVLSIGACIFSAVKAPQEAAKLIKNLSRIAEGVSSAVSGGFDIWNGAANLELAKTQKELADMKIALEQVDFDIKQLTEFIDHINEFVEAFIKNMLEGEEAAASTLQADAAANETLAAEVAKIA